MFTQYLPGYGNKKCRSNSVKMCHHRQMDEHYREMYSFEACREIWCTDPAKLKMIGAFSECRFSAFAFVGFLPDRIVGHVLGVAYTLYGIRVILDHRGQMLLDVLPQPAVKGKLGPTLTAWVHRTTPV